MNQESKTCQNCKKEFRVEPEDFSFYEKIKVPPPTFCPECRLQRRYAWRNSRSIYKRKCDFCGKDAIGVYSPDKPFKVYCSKCWWSDNWDAMEYGRDYDFSRPFFKQFYDLMKETPLVNRFVYEDTMVRSDYSNMAHYLKDCYLVFHGDYSERCYYSDQIDYCNDCFDISYSFQGELCYDSVNLQKCHNVSFSKDSESCHDCYFIRNCIGCSSCFGCANLRNKQYFIFNQPYSKKEYFKKLAELGFSSQSYVAVANFKEKAGNFWNTFPVKFMHGTHNSNVSGDYVNNSKNSFYCFNARGVEDSKFCTDLVNVGGKDSYDWTQYGEGGELLYDILQAGDGAYNDRFGWCVWKQTKNSDYCVLSINNSDCFGCVSVKNKKYCILNKQYSAEDYHELREKIIKHMSEMPYFSQSANGKEQIVYRYGEFLPIELSPFGYNESFAQGEFPLDSSSAEQKGYAWTNIDAYRGRYETTMNSSDLPDGIDDVNDNILNQTISCEKCGRPYRILELELNFYRNQKLPIPRLCVDCRYEKRIKNKNPSRLWHRKCQCAGVKSDNGVYQNTAEHFHDKNHCPSEFKTSYALERPEIVYCEECYQLETI